MLLSASPVLGMTVGLALGLAGFALGVVGLIAMGAESRSGFFFLGGVLLLVAAFALIAWSVLALRGTWARASS